MARRKKARRSRKGKAGYRVGKNGGVYRVKGKTKSSRKTYKTKSAALKAARKR